MGRFMGREHLQKLDVSWSHEPFTEGRLISNELRVRFMESLHGSGDGTSAPLLEQVRFT